MPGQNEYWICPIKPPATNILNTSRENHAVNHHVFTERPHEAQHALLVSQKLGIPGVRQSNTCFRLCNNRFSATGMPMSVPNLPRLHALPTTECAATQRMPGAINAQHISFANSTRSTDVYLYRRMTATLRAHAWLQA